MEVAFFWYLLHVKELIWHLAGTLGGGCGVTIILKETVTEGWEEIDLPCLYS